MSVMDFKLKGKTLVGNIYQKFEAICQEVDDIVRQDVKYIVSHVQKVGKSVKKLNSEALEDFLMPSENPVKHEAKIVTNTLIESIINGEDNTINNYSKLSNFEFSSQDIANILVTVPSLNSIDQKEYDFPFGEQGKSSTYDNSLEEIRKFANVNKSPIEDPQLKPFVDKMAHEGRLHLELLNENHESEHRNMNEAPSTKPHQIEDEIPNDILDGLELDPVYFCDSPSSGWEPLIIICENENSEMECSSPVLSPSTEAPLKDPQLIPFDDKMAHEGLLHPELLNENCESELMNMTEASSVRTPQFEVEIPNDVVDRLQLDPHYFCDSLPSGWEPLIIICKNENSEVGCSSPVRSPSTEFLLEDPQLIPFVDKMAHKGLLQLELSNENRESELRSMTEASSARPPQIDDEIPNDIVDGLELDPDSFCDSPPSGWEPLLIICENENSEMGCSSPVHSPSTESCQETATFLSELPQILSCENKVSDPSVCSSVLSLESNGVDSSSISDALAQSWLSGNTFISSSQIGTWDDSADNMDDPCMETIDLGDEVKLGDSCVIVDSDMLHVFSRRAGKHRSYKKLIQDALSSKRRITKEYEQLAIWHGDVDIDMRSSQHSSLDLLPSSDLKKVIGKDSGDSEWEII